MDKSALSLKYFQIPVIAICLFFGGVSCTPVVTVMPMVATPEATAIIPTLVAPQAATQATEVPTIIPPTPAASPTANLEAMPGLAGRWIDPDSSNGDTVSTIVWQNNTYVVTSVINSKRGGNELKTFSWANGVLTWRYCPSNMQDCIIQNTVTLNGNTLTVSWAWSSGNNSGTSDLQRQP
jgi:hypothetical protein